MSYNCIECGEKLIKADKPKIVKSELGFSIQIFPLVCKKCNTEYIICDECHGVGYLKNKNGIFDCPKCLGMNVIKI